MPERSVNKNKTRITLPAPPFDLLSDFSRFTISFSFSVAGIAVSTGFDSLSPSDAAVDDFGIGGFGVYFAGFVWSLLGFVVSGVVVDEVDEDEVDEDEVEEDEVDEDEADEGEEGSKADEVDDWVEVSLLLEVFSFKQFVSYFL